MEVQQLYSPQNHRRNQKGVFPRFPQISSLGSLLPLSTQISHLSHTLTSLLSATSPLPLSTSSRRIVDASRKRVKLAWLAHLDPVVMAEGLSKQPLESISKRINSLGFNCVRLTLLRHHLPWAKAIAGVLEAISGFAFVIRWSTYFGQVRR